MTSFILVLILSSGSINGGVTMNRLDKPYQTLKDCKDAGDAAISNMKDIKRFFNYTCIPEGK